MTGIDEAADQVVERLADPTDAAAYQTKGLVMGYVQSGKTASFTGVIAKAVDRGYRLVIVLSGTLNLLRAQTQRRLDMELVGKENILRGAPDEHSEYADDPAWQAGGFLSHGELLATRRVRRHPSHHPKRRLPGAAPGHHRARIREGRSRPAVASPP